MSNCCPPTIVFTSPPPCPRQHYKKSKSRRCSAQGPKKKMMCVELNGSNPCGGNQSGDKKKNFMEDVWKAMTPDMLNKLVDILVQDFNMSRAEACAFIKQQRDQSKQSQMTASGKCPCASDMVPAIPNMDVRNSMIKEFLEVTACKLSDYMAMVLCSKRTRRQKVMAQLMFDNMNSLFGAQEGDKIAAVTGFLADKLSLWLENLFDDSMCAEENGEKANEEEGNKEGTKEGVKEEQDNAEGNLADEPKEIKQEPPEEAEEEE